MKGPTGILPGIVLVVAGTLGSAWPEAAAAIQVPAWVKSARTVQFPDLPADAGAIVVLDEQELDVRPDGRMIATRRWAARILTRDGRGAAELVVPYIAKAEKIDTAKAWLIRPSGEIRVFERNDIADFATYGERELYSEARHVVASAESEALPGSVFGATITISGRTVTAQDLWRFQSRFPVVLSRYSVRLPPGWRAHGRVFNHPGIEPEVADRTTSWSLRNTPAFTEEPLGPAPGTLSPTLALTLFPSGDAAPKVLLKPFVTWAEVAAWLASLGDPPVVVDEPIRLKARDLTRESTSAWERIVAIGRFAQTVNYVSIQTRLGYGGGMVPHRASEVLRCNYGDCKDKVTLMRALLRAVGIESYYVGVFWGDPLAVRDDWPSPGQFNHAIIAIRVGPEIASAAAIDHPSLGRLLFFDPTDEDTLPGDLQADYQGSPALLVAPGDDVLIRLPVLPPEASRLERRIEARLAADGRLEATVRERSVGQEAARERTLFRTQPASDYRQMIVRWVGQSAHPTIVSDVLPRDDPASGEFGLEVTFSAPAYGQDMRGQLLVFRPALLGRRSFVTLTGKERTQPVLLAGRSHEEKARIALPPGYHADELPPPVSVVEGFGYYALSTRIDDGVLALERTLVIRPAVVPAEEYPTVQRFFEAITRAEQQPVVLERDGRPTTPAATAP